MRTQLTLAVALLAMLGIVGFANAASSKEVTLKGTLTCAKCALHKTDKCQNVLEVTKDDKTVLYYLTPNKTSKDAHPSVCQAPKKNITVVGKVHEKDGKEWLTASKIEGL